MGNGLKIQVGVERAWLKHVIECLQGDLPRGRIGDVVFLLRDQLQDILDKPIVPDASREETAQLSTRCAGLYDDVMRLRLALEHLRHDIELRVKRQPVARSYLIGRIDAALTVDQGATETK